MGVVRSYSLSTGIVGLPNSGKSTIFNALTKASVPAENYPFCTIDKNVGVVKVPDKRLDSLSAHYKSQKVVNSAITFVDIAGLVKGASKGEGLGNQFLAHIREVDLIMYVLRAFKDEKITHVYDNIDPSEDLKIIQAELILKDLETVEKRLEETKPKARTGLTEELDLAIKTLEKVKEGLNSYIPVYNLGLNNDENTVVSDLWLLTNKPSIYVLNVVSGINEKDISDWINRLKEKIPKSEQNFIIQIDCKMEGELDSLNEGEKEEIIGMVDEYKGISHLIELVYKRLDLITFYTGNEKEANAWSIGRGSSVKEAAGVIHTDLEKNFVAAEVINVDKMLQSGGWVKARELGLVKNVSKDYVVEDGDYINILASK